MPDTQSELRKARLTQQTLRFWVTDCMIKGALEKLVTAPKPQFKQPERSGKNRRDAGNVSCNINTWNKFFPAAIGDV